MKRLVGRTVVEDGLQRLDMLTREESLMTTARTLGVTGDIREDVNAVKEDTCDIKDDTRNIKEDARGIKEDTHNIMEDTRNINDNLEINKRGAPQFFNPFIYALIFLTYNNSNR
jgi:hypothetical protein